MSSRKATPWRNPEMRWNRDQYVGLKLMQTLVLVACKGIREPSHLFLRNKNE